MTGYFQAFDMDRLEKVHAAGASPYQEFLRRRGMSVGLYVLPKGGKDMQHLHASDEVYVVMRGSGTLRVGNQDQPVKAGSIVSVDHGEDHRFVDIEDELHLLVVFAPPEEPDD